MIPPPKAKQFERIARSTFPSDYKQCREFMRHKQFLLSPKFLAHHGIQSLRAVQRQGEFIITYPYSYHAGFNCGLNLAEAVNFATKSWIKIGKKAGYCTCIPDSVRIDMDALLGKPKPVQDIYCDESEEEEFDSRIGPIVPHFMGSRQAAPIPRSVPAMKRGGGRVGPSAGTTRPMLNAAPALGGHVSNAWTAGMMRPTQPGLWPRPYTPFPYPYPNPYLYPPHNRLQPFQMPRAVAPVPLLPVPILPARPVNSEPAAAVTKPQVAVNAAK